MKTFKFIKIIFLSIFVGVCFSSCKYDDNELKESFDQLENRIAILETLCKQNNENIVSLQTIVDVLETGDYITGVTAITNDDVEIGYKITFAKAGTITIYNGQNGKNGENGMDGEDGMDGADGHAPIVGVKQDSDGVYYWTIDGEFIVVDGQKMNVQGKDGKDGEDGKDGTDGKDGEDGKDGADGANGSNGKNGKDGLTPQFKIENGYWYISYNGTSWTNVGKATGEDGTNNCIFSGISQDSEKVYFTLADGTIIVVSKESKINDDTLLLPDGPTFNSIVGTFLENNTNLTKIKFVANSNVTSQSILVTDADGTIGYMVANGEWLEIHTLGKEFVANEICAYMFVGKHNETTPFNSLTEIDFGSNFNTSKVISMNFMFSFCENLELLDVSKFDTSNVIDMNAMFQSCKKLKIIDVSNFKTSNVFTFHFMFAHCNSIESLDVSKFDISAAKNVGEMFSCCRNLKLLDVSKFDTSNITNMMGMFAGCDNLISIDVSNFDTSNVVYMDHIFNGCENLTTLDLSNFDTSNVIDMNGMFTSCKKLEVLDISSFNTSKVTDMNSMFYGCESLTSIKLDHFNTSNVTKMNAMFMECINITTLDVANFDTSMVLDMSNMFSHCIKLTSLDVSNFDTSKVTNMFNLFIKCESLKFIDVSKFETSNVTNMLQMFYSCSSLEFLDLTNFSFSKSPDFYNMFKDLGNDATNKPTLVKVTDEGYTYFTNTNVDCGIGGSSKFVKPDGTDRTELQTSLYLSDGLAVNYAINTYLENENKNVKKIKFITESNMTSETVLHYDRNGAMAYLIYNEECLEIHTASRRIIANEDCSFMFSTAVTFHDKTYKYFEKLVEIDFGNNFNTEKTINMGSMFSQCKNLLTLNISSFNTTNVTDISGLFCDCSQLKTIDVNHFNTSNVTNMMSVFNDCFALENVNMSSFDTSNVTDMSWMFHNCWQLTSLDLTNFTFEKNPTTDKMLATVGLDVNTKPTPIKVTEAGHKYLTETTTDCGIGTTAKFVKPDGTDW